METRLFHLGLLIAILAFNEVTFAQEPVTPQLILMPKEIRQNLGESVYVSCIPRVPSPELVTSVEWRNFKKEIINTDDMSITTLEGLGGPNQLDLMIRKLRKEDVGNYTCSAIYAGNQKLEAIIQISYQVSIDFKDTETLQAPVLHSDAKIRCIVASDPAPLIDWTKDGIPLSKTDKRYIQQNDGILIKNIREDDEGVYRCRARVPELGQIDFRDIQVEVRWPPEITGTPKDTAGVEKESVAFQCVAKGKPAPTYSWVNRDSELLNNKEGYYVDELTGELKILDLRPDHAGKYRCTAQNSAGETTAEATLRVLTKPKIEQLLNLTVPVDSDAQLRCVVSGDPLPKVVFRKEVLLEPFRDGVNTDHRITVEQDVDELGRRVGILRIDDLMRKDDGLYSCKGISSGGEEEGWGHITVEFPPTFEDQPINEFWSWEQKPVNLSCLATSIPNATIQWYQREDTIRETDPNLKIISYGPNGILRVTPLDGSYFDTYTCRATNTIGEADYDVILKQVEKPGPVSSTQVEKLTATTVSWNIRDPLEDGGRPIIGYTVQYKFADTAWDKSESTYWAKGSDRTYVVDHLTPDADYVFRFAAKNDVGDGEWSGEKSIQMPRRSSPEEPLIFGTKYPEVKAIPYTNHYELQWQVPLDNGEPIDYFQIVYYTVRNNSGKWEKQGSQVALKVPYPGPSTYKLENLLSNSYYKIELRAHNEIGYSTPSEAIIKTAFDPAAVARPGASGQLNNVAPTSPSNAPAQPVYEEKSEANTGLIIAIVLVFLLVVIIAIDVICFFLKNAGVIATVVRKLGSTPGEKDKEAMIEDGPKENAKSEGNGKAKDIEKSADKRDPSKEKDATETTPMIEGRFWLPGQGKPCKSLHDLSREYANLDSGVDFSYYTNKMLLLSQSTPDVLGISLTPNQEVEPLYSEPPEEVVLPLPSPGRAKPPIPVRNSEILASKLKSEPYQKCNDPPVPQKTAFRIAGYNEQEIPSDRQYLNLSRDYAYESRVAVKINPYSNEYLTGQENYHPPEAAVGFGGINTAVRVSPYNKEFFNKDCLRKTQEYQPPGELKSTFSAKPFSVVYDRNGSSSDRTRLDSRNYYTARAADDITTDTAFHITPYHRSPNPASRLFGETKPLKPNIVTEESVKHSYHPVLTSNTHIGMNMSSSNLQTAINGNQSSSVSLSSSFDSVESRDEFPRTYETDLYGRDQKRSVNSRYYHSHSVDDLDCRSSRDEIVGVESKPSPSAFTPINSSRSLGSLLHTSARRYHQPTVI